MAAKLAVFTTPPADEVLHPRWRRDAACRDSDPNVMFPPDGRNTRARAAMENRAKALCHGSHTRTRNAPACPVRRECLATALWRGEEHGVWGGLTAGERTRLGPSGRLTAADALAAADRMLRGLS